MQNDRQDEQAILKTIHDFLDGIQTRDREAMLRQVLPDGGATLLRNGEPLHMSMSGVIERIEFDAAIVMIESIHDHTILIDSDIAMAWTPYEFFMNGVLHHLGTNIFTLLRRNGRWLISGVADYSRPPHDVPQ